MENTLSDVVTTLPESDSSEAAAPREKRSRGFALMTAEKQRAIASAGGKEAHRIGRAHRFSSEDGRRAGQLGGRKVSQDREYMRTLGRKGGRAKKSNELERASASA